MGGNFKPLPRTKYVLSGTSAYYFATTLNHELCHALGLGHPFQGLSSCADASVNANCWNLNSPPGPDCDAWSKVSNNLMDTNADQAALSPCQVGTIQNNLNTCLKSRFVYKCSNCLPTVANFDLSPGTCGQLTNIWLDGRASWDYFKFKLETDRLDSGDNLVVGTHYETTPWRRLGREQLDALYAFLPNSTYRVQVTTYNQCGATAVRVRTLSTSDCTSLTNPASVPATVSFQR